MFIHYLNLIPVTIFIHITFLHFIFLLLVVNSYSVWHHLKFLSIILMGHALKKKTYFQDSKLLYVLLMVTLWPSPELIM